MERGGGGVNYKIDELKHFLKEHKIDIMTINETKLTKNTQITFRNYTIHRQDRNQYGGGVAIIIKNNIPHIRLPQLNITIEHVSIKFWNEVVFTGCYAPPSIKMTDRQLDSIFRQAPRVLALGDFNAKHFAWNNPYNNPRGTALYDYATQNNIQILCTPTPTYYSNHAQARVPSFLDIGLNKNIQNLLQPTTISELPSDHNPITLIWNTETRPEPGQTTWILKNANWNRFRNELNNKIRNT